MEQEINNTTPLAFCVTELNASRKLLLNIAEQLPTLKKQFEKHRSTEKEHDALLSLSNVARKAWDETLYVIPRLVEYGDTTLAQTAKKLYAALKRFNYLKCTDYTGICAAIKQFSDSLPGDDQNINLGRLAHLANRAKLGYYPTDLYHVERIKDSILFPEESVHLIDPCCGEGLALEAFSKGGNAFTYGVELDEVRGEEATRHINRVAFGSYFHSRISLGAFQGLWLNPPYLSVPSASGSRRLEKAFLADSVRLLQNSGVMVYIVPYYRLTLDVCKVLCENFCDLRVHRFVGKPFERFHQIAVIGIKTEKRDANETAKRLFDYMLDIEKVPDINELPNGIYEIPKPVKKPELFKGAVFNILELEDQLKASKSIEKIFENRTLDKKDRRPLLPLTLSQIGLIGASGMMNGLVECETPHIIKGRIVKEKHSDSAENDKRKTEVRETTTNKLIFNVLTTGGMKSLG